VIDHLGISVKSHAQSRSFYLQALGPLGVAVVMEVSKEESGAPSDHTGFGMNGKPYFWITEGAVVPGMHLALVAQTRKQVDDFYKAALAGGGKDNGAPGIRAQYHPNYYGAFVIDPNGVNLEAVCHTG
jgi:catechol 2,3-dioxygenase-like lactoylglutathione lyase family enzyme